MTKFNNNNNNNNNNNKIILFKAFGPTKLLAGRKSLWNRPQIKGKLKGGSSHPTNGIFNMRMTNKSVIYKYE